MQRDPLSRWLIGLFGGVSLFFILPRAVRFMFKTFFVGVLAEVVTIVAAGLLTEKAAESVTERPERSRTRRSETV